MGYVKSEERERYILILDEGCETHITNREREREREHERAFFFGFGGKGK